MTQILLPPLMVYAACGLALSLTVHVLSFFGIQFGGNALFMGLHVGIFPLWIPVVLIAAKMVNGAQRKDFWKIALSGCPVWMRYMTYGFFSLCDWQFHHLCGLSCSDGKAERCGRSDCRVARFFRALDGLLFCGPSHPNHGLSPRSFKFAASVSQWAHHGLARSILSDMWGAELARAGEAIAPNLSCQRPRKRGIHYAGAADLNAGLT
jgi:hypothetical protein